MSHALVERSRRPDLFSADQYVSADPGTPSRPNVSDGAFAFVLAKIHEAGIHFHIPVGRWVVSPQQRFEQLARIWRAETGPSSSASEMAMHPAYQRIIGMGREAVPFLLRELEREPDHWFWALKAITGVDPVDAGHRGDVEEMARAWLQWGREQGYI